MNDSKKSKIKLKSNNNYNNNNEYQIGRKPGFDGVHDRLALEMDRCLQKADEHEWITKEKPTLTQKDPKKGTTHNTYWSITCLPMMGKILMGQIREEIYDSLTSHKLFLEDAEKDPDAQESYSTLVSTFSMRARGDGKI